MRGVALLYHMDIIITKQRPLRYLYKIRLIKIIEKLYIELVI